MDLGSSDENGRSSTAKGGIKKSGGEETGQSFAKVVVRVGMIASTAGGKQEPRLPFAPEGLLIFDGEGESK